MKKKLAIEDVLSDFFGNQDVVRVAGIYSGIEHAYAPARKGALLQTVREHYPKYDLMSTAHEIGHFVTAPITRLDKINYGYKRIIGEWTVGAINLELDVIARQKIIMDKKDINLLEDDYFGDLTALVENRGKTYILSVPGLREKIDLAGERRNFEVLKDHLRGEVEKRAKYVQNGYEGIVEEFHIRCKILAAGINAAA